MSALAAVFFIWVSYTNLTLGLTRYNLKFKSLPQAFEGFKIAQISDYHNTSNENLTASILNYIEEEQPDLIVITGDLIDSRTPEVGIILNLIESLVHQAPVYFVTGNHEAGVSDEVMEELRLALRDYGVISLRNQAVNIQRGTDQILLVGLDDPQIKNKQAVESGYFSGELNRLASEKIFSILLSHRPEHYEDYLTSAVNLVLTGHVHGGQFRLPFLGGVFAPNQGFFPEYDSGVYGEEDFSMVVSRGIGNSVIPVRFNNQPELVIVELHTQ